MAMGSLASGVLAFFSNWRTSSASLSSFPFTNVMATVAPSKAKEWQTARLNPESPPVTSATFPCSADPSAVGEGKSDRCHLKPFSQTDTIWSFCG
ncbi:unnamed protein product [Linum tenue]|uniref:Secreted protein n=1 Tax=Linum tenue TaxID=586396 RepID=A0AAV0R3S9_9ROSI|nr:unnamed protein product [Linum tenue]